MNAEGEEPISLQPELRRYSEELVHRLRRTLGSKLVGVYLHGSAAVGDFSPSRSDVDGVAVVSGELTDQERNLLAQELGPSALPCLGTGLEFHVVAASTLVRVTDAPPFEMHIATDTKNGRERFVDGVGRAGDADLVMHYAVLKARGITLLGPPASELSRRYRVTACSRRFEASLTGDSKTPPRVTRRSTRHAHGGLWKPERSSRRLRVVSGRGAEWTIRRSLISPWHTEARLTTKGPARSASVC
jgi:hypothetical protein